MRDSIRVLEKFPTLACSGITKLMIDWTPPSMTPVTMTVMRPGTLGLPLSQVARFQAAAASTARMRPLRNQVIPWAVRAKNPSDVALQGRVRDHGMEHTNTEGTANAGPGNGLGDITEWVHACAKKTLDWIDEAENCGGDPMDGQTVTEFLSVRGGFTPAQLAALEAHDREKDAKGLHSETVREALGRVMVRSLDDDGIEEAGRKIREILGGGNEAANGQEVSWRVVVGYPEWHTQEVTVRATSEAEAIEKAKTRAGEEESNWKSSGDVGDTKLVSIEQG